MCASKGGMTTGTTKEGQKANNFFSTNHPTNHGATKRLLGAFGHAVRLIENNHFVAPGREHNLLLRKHLDLVANDVDTFRCWLLAYVVIEWRNVLLEVDDFPPHGLLKLLDLFVHAFPRSMSTFFSLAFNSTVFSIPEQVCCCALTASV